MGCNLSTPKPDDTAQAIRIKPPFQQNFRDVDSSRMLNRTQLKEAGQLFAGISTASQPAVFQFVASPASPSSQLRRRSRSSIDAPPQQTGPEHDLTPFQRVLCTFIVTVFELTDYIDLGPEGLNLLPDFLLEEEEKPHVSFDDRFAVILVALRLNRPVIVRDQPVIFRQPEEGDETAQRYHELTNQVDVQLKRILDRRIQNAALREYLQGIPMLDRAPPEDQHLTYPDLDPSIQHPDRPTDQIFESIEAYLDQQHVTTFLMESTSSKLVEFYLSQRTGYQKPLDELTLIAAFQLDFNNRWTANCNLVDYTAIRFLDWWPDWWPLDRAISFTSSKMYERLKQLKICTKRSDPNLAPLGVQIRLMATQLSNLRVLPMLECLEIDKLYLSTIATTLTFPALQLLSIDSIEVLDGDRIVTNPTSLKYLTIDAVNLQEIYLDSIEHVAFSEYCKLIQLTTDRVPQEADLRRPYFESLEVLECNRLESDLDVKLIGRIACGKLLKGVRFLFCNTDKLLSTWQTPSEEACNRLYQLFGELLCDGIRRDLRFYVNHVRLNDPKYPAPELLALFQYRSVLINHPLIYYHHHNFYENFLRLRPCKTVENVNFHGVLSTFYRQEPIGHLSGLGQFTRQYPNIRKVTLDCSSSKEPLATAERFIDFLKDCRGLTELNLRWPGFTNRNFYSKLPHILSLRTLESLYLFEFPREFELRNEQIDFDYYLVAFLYLHRVHTNLAPMAMASGYLDRMRVGSELSFLYDRNAVKSVLIVRRFDLRSNSAEYEVTFEQQEPMEDPVIQDRQQVNTLDEAKCILQNHLNEIQGRQDEFSVVID